MSWFVRSGFGTLAAALLALGVAGCHSKNVIEAPVPAPTPDPLVTRAFDVVLVDAATGIPVTSPVEVAVLSKDGLPSTLSQDASGNPQNVFTTSSGLVTFRGSSSAPLPLEFVLVATGAGFNGGTMPLTWTTDNFTDVDGDHDLDTFITMVRVGAPPPGIGAVNDPNAGTADVNGTTAAPITLTATEPTTGSAAGLSIPTATTVTDAGGAALTGVLSADISYYSNASDDALLAVPGGLGVTTDQGAGAFFMGGLTAVQLRDASGKVASNLTNPASLRVGLSPGTVNPDTDVALVAGDLVPVWNYVDHTGVWTKLGDFALTDAGGGRLEAVVPTSRLLSARAGGTAGGRIAAVTAAAPSATTVVATAFLNKKCTKVRPIIVRGDSALIAFDLFIASVKKGYAVAVPVIPFSDPVTVASLGKLQPKTTPSGVPSTLTAKIGATVIGSVTAPDLCDNLNDNLPIEVPVTLPPGMLPATLTVNVIKQCIEDPTRTAPIASASCVAVSGKKILTKMSDVNGVAVFNGLKGAQTISVSVSRIGVAIGTATVVTNPGSNSLTIAQKVTCTGTGATGGL